jgi:hypothetical protein
MTFTNNAIDLSDILLEQRQLAQSKFLHTKIFWRSSMVWPNDAMPLKENLSNSACDNKHGS